MRIGVLTSGGDCPGLNAVLRSVVHHAVCDHGDEVVGLHDGWHGLLEGDHRLLDPAAVAGALGTGGTLLGSSRIALAELPGGVELARERAAALGLDVIIAIGGAGTLDAAHLLARAGLPAVGVPRTVDDGIAATDAAFGFDTAVAVAAHALDRLRMQAASRQLVVVAEVAGRRTGWVALQTGLATGADVIAVPERPFSVHALTEAAGRSLAAGRRCTVAVVAEGATAHDALPDAPGPGVAELLAAELQQRLGVGVHPVPLGPAQRGGAPTAYDRVLASRFGRYAVETARRRAGAPLAVMTALRGEALVPVPLTSAPGHRPVPPERYAEVGCVL
ncbi:ATP-dependent 6-phosphofructokinase [Streptomyces sp. NPDC049585]|uniref:ATP-dependent 6-phosphofructokinase n=1 Tax=Streptomyces sp. NPDC049585 TaxID=3155154 RepID=UPI003448CC69